MLIYIGLLCLCVLFCLFFFVVSAYFPRILPNEMRRKYIKMIWCYTRYCVSTHTYWGAFGLILIRSWHKQLVQILEQVDVIIASKSRKERNNNTSQTLINEKHVFNFYETAIHVVYATLLHNERRSISFIRWTLHFFMCADRS